MMIHTRRSPTHLVSLESQDIDWLTREMTHQLGRDEMRLAVSSSKNQEREISKDIDHESRILAALRASNQE